MCNTWTWPIKQDVERGGHEGCNTLKTGKHSAGLFSANELNEF